MKNFIALFLSLTLSVPAAFGATQDTFSVKPPPNAQCKLVLRHLKAMTKDEAKRDGALAEYTRLKNDIDRRVRDQYQVDRITFVNGTIEVERLMMLLAQGKTKGAAKEEILALVSGARDQIIESYKNINTMLAAIHELENNPSRTRDEDIHLASLEQAFISESHRFGQQYPYFVMSFRLLENVANGKGAGQPMRKVSSDIRAGQAMLKSLAEINAEENVTRKTAIKGTKRKSRTEPDVRDAKPMGDKPLSSPAEFDLMVYNLKSPAAISLAQMILRLQDGRIMQSWVNESRLTADPTLEDIEYMFRHNIYALIGSMQRFVAEQKKADALWKKGLNAIATFYTNVLVNSPTIQKIPILGSEPIRNVVLNMTGLSYDSLMLFRYLGKIQSIVEITRFADEDGNVVLRTSKELVQLQLDRLSKSIGGKGGQNLLVLFYRIKDFRDVWVTLMKEVDGRTKETGEYSNQYPDLLARMKDAEKAGKERGEMPYVYGEPTTPYLVFLTTQLTWLVAEGYGTWNYIIPFVKSFVGAGE